MAYSERRVIYMYYMFKMTEEQVIEVNKLLKDHRNSLTALIEEYLRRGEVIGFIGGVSMCLIVKRIKEHKKSEKES